MSASAGRRTPESMSKERISMNLRLVFDPELVQELVEDVWVRLERREVF